MTKFWNRFEEIFLVGTLAVMVLLIFGQVVGRYIFQTAPSWTEEIARYVHVFQVWVGAGYVVKLREHIRVSAFVNLFHGTPRKALEMTAAIIWFAISVLLAVFGTKLVIATFGYGQTSPAAQIYFWIPYLAVPIGGASMAIRLIQQMRDISRGDYNKPGEVIE